MAKQELEAGDKIVFGRGKKNSALFDITIGKVYQLHTAMCQVAFSSDNGYTNYPESGTYIGKPTKIVEA